MPYIEEIFVHNVISADTIGATERYAKLKREVSGMYRSFMM